MRTILLVVLFAPVTILAQDPQGYQEEVTIIGSYTPTISEAYKINFNPTIEMEEFKLPELTYSISPVQLNTFIELNKITPAKITGEPLSKLYRNYVKLGYGNYGTPYFEFFVNSLRSEETQLGVRLKHHSSNKSIKDYENSTFSNNYAEVYLKKFFKKHTLNTDVYYKRNVVHYYGFEPGTYADTLFKTDDLKQRYQTFGFDALLASNYVKPGKLGHQVGVKYYYLSDIHKTSEHGVNLNAGLKKGVELFDRNYTDFGLDFDMDYYMFSDTMANVNDGVARFNPYANLNFGQYQVRVGFTTAIGLDSNSKIDFFPDIKAKIDVVPKYLTAFAGFTGGIEKSSFRKLSDDNPFIVNTVPQRFTKNKMEFYGGITGNIGEVVDLTIRVGSASYENMPLFVNYNDTIAPTYVFDNSFTVIYDDVSVTNARFEIGYRHTEKLRLRLRADYYHYKTDTEIHAWHKPEYKINLGAAYNIGNKFLIKGELIGYGKMYYKVFGVQPDVLTTHTINGWIDMNLGVEFRYTKNLSVFANFNNVGNTEYQRWYHYPAQKFNFLAGLTYGF